MEDRASKRALEAYPKMSRISEHHSVIPADYKSHYIGDANEEKRIGFIEGYHQAEKDLELTWEDMRELYIIFAEVDVEIELCKADNIKSETIGYFQEVLKRFKDYKERKQQ